MSGPKKRISRWHDPDEEPPPKLLTINLKRKEQQEDATKQIGELQVNTQTINETQEGQKTLSDGSNDRLRSRTSTTAKAATTAPTKTGARVGASSDSCRSADLYERIQKIGEGTYGSVYKARCRASNELVALKRLKLESETEGFPQTSVRETITLLKGKHPNVINIREIVFNNGLDQVYIVMDYMDRDLRSLMKDMNRPFNIAEFKLLLKQLISAVAHLHNNWILHRDIKPSNLLIHKGVLKVGDFGLAREYGSPLNCYTSNVVTLWYRAPELLLQTGKYSTPIDVWSIGCIFGELLTKRALFEGQTAQQQIRLIFEALGSPTEELWPEFEKIKIVQKFNFNPSKYKYNTLLEKLEDKGKKLSKKGFHLWNRLLAYDPGIKLKSEVDEEFVRKPTHRITAEAALEHDFFDEEPKPIHPSLFPTWPKEQSSRS